MASVGVGVLRVTAPADAQIELDARVGGGRLSLFGNRQVGIGAVIVETEAANGG